jgi:magnesium-transporting ATPase (P-type)
MEFLKDFQNERVYLTAEEEVLTKLQSGREGLSTAQASERLNALGPNSLPKAHQLTLWQIILHQVANPLIIILAAAAVACIFIGEIADAFFVLVVILINSTIGTYQEYQAEKSASNLQNLLKIMAHVKRDGREKVVPAEEVVLGDIVLLESGRKVPADLRLMSAGNLDIDESFLTGESIAAHKNSAPLAQDAPVADRVNMAFAGSTVMSGRGEGVVTATGTQTQVGAIAQNVSEGESAKPPLLVRMERFTKQITGIILVVSVLLAVLLRLQGEEYSAIFFLVVALAVAAIPEGLPVALTVALSIATKRMAKRNVIVRRLTAVESLGSCTVIASDKTGTLTVNEQTVRQVVIADGTTYRVTGEGYNGQGDVQLADSGDDSPDSSPKLETLMRVGVLANEASLWLEGNEWKHHGDAMDVALLALAYKYGQQPDDLRAAHPIVQLIPYESEHKYSAAYYEHKGQVYVAAKGAVETILDFCDLDEGSKNRITTEADVLASKGYRVLAFAEGVVPNHVSGQSIATMPSVSFVGMACFLDPLRPEAKEAVETCVRAGIKVLMITGDHPETAAYISRDLGILQAGAKVVTGKMLSEAGQPTGEPYEALVSGASVFARVSPSQKLEIVDVLIRKGEFVAVTGDGVNDAPAMKRANLGVAMGSGTDVAKEVGEMIAVDDNFSSIVAGVEEGRYAYDNVRKVIYLLISTGLAEVLLFVASVSAELPMPLLAVQLLWLNLVTNGIQDVALAFEKGEKGTMCKPPRDPREGIFNPLMIKQLLVAGVTMAGLSFGLWYWLVRYTEVDEFTARNAVLMLFVLMQNMHAFNVRSEVRSAFKVPFSNNWILVGGIVVAQLLHLFSTHIPFMQQLLRIEPVSPIHWKYLLGLAAVLLAVIEVFKLWYRSTLTYEYDKE